MVFSILSVATQNWPSLLLISDRWSGKRSNLYISLALTTLNYSASSFPHLYILAKGQPAQTSQEKNKRDCPLLQQEHTVYYPSMIPLSHIFYLQESTFTHFHCKKRKHGWRTLFVNYSSQIKCMNVKFTSNMTKT